MAPRLFSLQGLLLQAAVEALLAVRFLPEYLPTRNAFVWIFVRLLPLNYFLYAVHWGLIYPYFVSPLRHFPSAKNLGARLWYLKYVTKPPPGQFFLQWSSETENEGILLLRSPFHMNRILITKPKALADLLVKNPYDFVKPRTIRDFLRQALGDGLIIVEGGVHRFQRKHTMPAFSFRHIKDLYPMMWRKAVLMTESIATELAHDTIPAANPDEKAVTKSTEIGTWAGKVTLDIIGVAGLGTEFNMLKNSDHQLVRDYEELLQPTTEKTFYFLMCASFTTKWVRRIPWKMNDIFQRTTTSLKSITAKLVQVRREAIKTGTDDHFDILSLLIQSNNFSNEELVDQMLTFLAAGHETTASAFTWVTYLLATHPEIQTRLREEVREAIPSDSTAHSAIDVAGILERLPLLNGVCNETLRLYPTVPITMRIARRDTRLLDHRIPKGTEILLSPWAINRSPELWGEHAEKFMPERWIEDGKPNNSGGSFSNYSQLTFLHGPRSCIGQNFAKAELRCIVAAFVCAFEWTLDMKEEDVVPAGIITIKPKKGMHLKLKPLGRW